MQYKNTYHNILCCQGIFWGDVEILSKKTPSEIGIDFFPGLPLFEGFSGISKTSGHIEILKEKGSIKIKGRMERLLFFRKLKPKVALNNESLNSN
jgi:hypothetical protein